MLNHFSVSLVKSGLRIVAAGMLAQGDLISAGCLFAVAEVLGVVEELV
tara:strand:+ start:1718 stop:1861 length:144 start_codon:yes stop_codon:yes gene_type:complete